MFDHLADPAPPVPDAATRAAVADRARRLGRRRAATRQVSVAVVAVLALGSALLVTTAGRRGPIDAADEPACCPGVEGTVRDQVGVVARVIVQLIDPGAPPTAAPAPPPTEAGAGAGPVPTGPGWRVVARAVSGADGRFRIGDVAPGRYAVRFEDQFDTLAGKVRHHPAFLGGADTLSGARLVDVAAGEPVRVDQRLELSPNHGIRGSVREERRSYPVRNVTVRLFSGGQLVRQAMSDDQGRYDLGGLRSGSYQLAFLDEWDRPTGRYVAAWARGGAELPMPEDRDLDVDAVLSLVR